MNAKKAHEVNRFVFRFEAVFVILHAIDNVFVKTKAKKFLAGYQWLQNEPQTFLNYFKLAMIVVLGVVWIMGQYRHGKH